MFLGCFNYMKTEKSLNFIGKQMNLTWIMGFFMCELRSKNLILELMNV